MFKIKKNICFLTVALLVSFLLVTATSSYVGATENVKVGVILPLSGPVAPIGKTAKSGLDYAVIGNQCIRRYQGFGGG